MVKKRLLSLKDMEPIAREATRKALGEYPAPPKSEQSKWALGKIETLEAGIFEIYIPNERPLDTKVISCARVDRHTGAVSVDVFLDKLADHAEAQGSKDTTPSENSDATKRTSPID